VFLDATYCKVRINPRVVSQAVDLVAAMLTERFPAVAEMLLDAKVDLTAFEDFPHAHWRKI
jgi:putative transposase